MTTTAWPIASPDCEATSANPNIPFRFYFAYFCFALVLSSAAVLVLGATAAAQQTSQEKQLFEALNKSRQEAGQPALEWDERLAQPARQHSKLMAESNQLGHSLKGEPPVAERLAATGIRFNRSGENVGYNSDFNDLHRAWMESSGHRENILNPNFTVVGIGIAQGDDGLYYATQDFAHALAQHTAEQAEDLVAQAINELRQKERHSPLERINKAGLRDLACNMARSGKLDAQRAAELPNVRESLVYNNSRPEELPATAKKMLDNNRIAQFAAGACFTGDHPENPGGTFYVVLAFY